MKKKRDKILIFYQSISEISFIIQILKNYEIGECILIVTGGEHFISVIKKSKIESTFGVKVYTFHALSLKNPLNLIKMYFRAYHGQISKKLSYYNFRKTYFFSEYEDFIAPIFLSKKNINEIILIDNYKDIFKKKNDLSFRNYFKKILIQLLLINVDVKINFYSLKYSNKNFNSINFPKYNLYKKKINRINTKKTKILSDFKLKLDNKILCKKNIMYIDSNDEELVGDEFKKIIKMIFNYFLIRNYNIVIKRPTRENLSPSLVSQSKFKYINDPTPIELYDLSRFQFIFGFMTTALPKISEKNNNIKVCSIVNLLSKNKKKEFKKVIYHFHKNLKSNQGKIFYPSSLINLIKHS